MLARRPFHAACLAIALSFAAVEAKAQDTLSPDVIALIEAQAAKIRELEARLARLEARGEAAALPRGAAEVAAPPQEAPVALAQAQAPPAAPAAASKPAGLAPPTLRGRAQFDALVYNNDEGSQSTGTEVRRFRLGAKGDLSERLSYVAEADFGGAEVSLQDVTLTYELADGRVISAGHFKPPITMDELTSSNETLFLERSAYASTFAPGRRLGVAASAWGEHWGVSGGLFGEAEDGDLDTEREEAWLAAVRGYVDLLSGDPALHLGLSAYHTAMPARGPGVWLRVRPETGRAPRLLDTGAFIADEGTFAGVEIGYGDGPLTLQAEGGGVDYAGAISGPDFHGWSAQAAWRWTGEPRPYDIEGGVFGRIRPTNPLGQGGMGALETGVRFTYLDLGDETVDGGEMTTYGVVVNWLPITRLRLSANLIQARIERLRARPVDETLLTLRTAIDW
ncbi:porin [Phenylobacterium sp.]|jgi:phosphate-selective porin OprO/OprP|uniref:OprO/OprP family phosphate-selective porin n=1 Tax=Phenylobacterium sp. TaxID=1871053 RepID=UPI00260A4738|nr:porin [Phenylobacterium sp.]